MCRFSSGHSWFTASILKGAALTGLLSVAMASADVFHMPAGLTSLETVFVGNPGNIADTAAHSGSPAGQGAVSYAYNIGKYEVTAGQYCEFLNKVAATDNYGLYSGYCQITRHGTSGSYTYDFSDRPAGTTEADWANRPVSGVSWGDASRFINWLHNGQPTGAQGLSTTEDGSYYLNGVITDAALMGVTRKTGAAWFIPSEDEWYKAAYHKNGGNTADYFTYSTSSDTAPGHDIEDPLPGNNANYSQLSIEMRKQTTLVGQFQNSASPYGTFDQGGNVKEWNEARFSGSERSVRGGSYISWSSYFLASSFRGSYRPAYESSVIGFRVASLIVPEPSSMTLLVVGAIAVLLVWQRRTTR